MLSALRYLCNCALSHIRSVQMLISSQFTVTWHSVWMSEWKSGGFPLLSWWTRRSECWIDRWMLISWSNIYRFRSDEATLTCIATMEDFTVWDIYYQWTCLWWELEAGLSSQWVIDGIKCYVPATGGGNSGLVVEEKKILFVVGLLCFQQWFILSSL